MIQIVLLVKLVSPVCMIYRCAEESISTLISVPGGCGSPRPGTGKRIRDTGPIGKPQTELPTLELERQASVPMHAVGAAAGSGWGPRRGGVAELSPLKGDYSEPNAAPGVPHFGNSPVFQAWGDGSWEQEPTPKLGGSCQRC